MAAILAKENSQIKPKPIVKNLERLIQAKDKKIDEILSILPDKDNLDLELLFTAVYCIVSDFIEMTTTKRGMRTSNNNTPKFTDAEVMTIALVGELALAKSVRSWHRFVQKNYRELFPDICTRTRFMRRQEKLQQVVYCLQQNLVDLLSASTCEELLVDSFPIEICKIQRLKSSTQPFEYHGADIGYCAAKKLHDYGFKGHIVTDLRGIPVFLTLTAASKSDLHSFDAVACEMSMLGIANQGHVFIGDKGYVGKDFQQYILDTYGFRLVSMKRIYKNQNESTALNELFQSMRKIVESTINLFSCQFQAGSTTRRTPKGLVLSLLTKLTAFNLANFFNYLLDQPLLEVTSFVY